MLSYEEDLDLYIKKQNEVETPASVRQKIYAQNERMLKYVMPITPPNKLIINHHDLLNLPKTSFRKNMKKK
jgi:hypothetical protein